MFHPNGECSVQLSLFTFSHCLCVITSVNGSWMGLCNRSSLCIYLSLCQQDYCKSNEPISLKLDVMIEPTSARID